MNAKPVTTALFAACLVNPFVGVLAAKPDKPTPPPPEPTVSGVAVVDSTGKLMGKFLGSGGVMLTVEGTSYGLLLQGIKNTKSSNGIPDNTKMEFTTYNKYYLSSDCTGEAYSTLYTPALGINQAVVINDEDGRTLLYPASPTDLVTTPIGSMSSSTPSAPFTCVTQSYPVTVVLLQNPIDITGQFTPPFTIK